MRYWEPLDFELPAGGGQYVWRRWIDTALDSPRDIVPWESAELVNGTEYRAENRSVVVSHSRTGSKAGALREVYHQVCWSRIQRILDQQDTSRWADWVN